MSADPSAPRPRWRRVVGSTWFHLAAAIVVTSLVLTFVAKPYWVPSGSMEQTLQPGDRVLVNRLAYLGTGPGTGDVIVFDADATWGAGGAATTDPIRAALRVVGEVSGFGPSGEHTLIKRVIGTPGQTVSCCSAAGAVVVDGTALSEPYVTEDLPFTPGTLDCTTTPRSTRCFDAVTVPENAYLVLGDNRADSADSALACRRSDADASCWRWAHTGDIVGRAVVILWPLTRWSGL